MLVYNKKLYLSQIELEEFYKFCHEEYKNFQFDIEKSRYKKQIRKSYKTIQDVINDFNDRDFMYTSSNIFGFIIGRSYLNPDIIYYVNMQNLIHNLMTYHIEYSLCNSYNFDCKPNFDLKNLGNEFIKNPHLSYKIKFENFDFMIELNDSIRYIYNLNDKDLDRKFITYFNEYLLECHFHVRSINRYNDLKMQLNHFEKSDPIMMIGSQVYNLK